MEKVDVKSMIYDYETGMSFVNLALKYGYRNKRWPKFVLEHQGVHLRKSGAVPGPRHPKWKGGKQLRSYGKSVYYATRVKPDDPMYSMAMKSGYVLEHRLVMARYLGRPLNNKETVHHLDGNTMNNEITNLQLRQGKHGKGIRMVCNDCGSHNVRPAEL